MERLRGITQTVTPVLGHQCRDGPFMPLGLWMVEWMVKFVTSPCAGPGVGRIKGRRGQRKMTLQIFITHPPLFENALFHYLLELISGTSEENTGKKYGAPLHQVSPLSIL